MDAIINAVKLVRQKKLATVQNGALVLDAAAVAVMHALEDVMEMVAWVDARNSVLAVVRDYQIMEPK